MSSESEEEPSLASSDSYDSEASVEKAPAKKQTAKAPAQPKKAAAPKKTKKNSNPPSDDKVEDGDDDEVMAVATSSSNNNKKEKKSIEDIYQKKTQLEHILLRPDTYIGSTETLQAHMWVMDDESSKKLSYRNISYVPGLFKIFDEILVNAADNKQRDPSMSAIKVTVDRENNTISVYNNGRGIPIEMHAKEKVYVPELIFGHLLTSSNYDDSEKKVTGGRNGYGAKLCNIFSTEFIVETGDSKKGRKYKQKFSKNMTEKGEPTVKSVKTEDFTKITFKPDLQKFGMTHMDDDITALFKKRAYDMAGCLVGVTVSLNDNKIRIKNFKEYIDLFTPAPESVGEGLRKPPPVIYEKVSDRWEIAFTVSDGQFQQVSFVNSICTSKGGTHVTHVSDQIGNVLMELAKKKEKTKNAKESVIKPHLVKSQLSVFVNCLIENPTFDSQTKENMTLKVSSFGSKCSISEEFMKKVSKSGVLDNILAVAKFKHDQAMKKTDGKSGRTRISGIAKLDDANNAGSKSMGQHCTLILTEGDSAKSLAVSGLSVIGRDNYGVFPLRGKLLNVREAAGSMISNNAEISALKQIIGLQQGKKYESTKDLRYGHIMIMTDQDHDGSHIKGLIINFLECFWPSLLKIPGFLMEFITPIVKVTPKNKNSRKEAISFFTIPEYEEWKKQNDEGKGYTIKYYKGLGTSTTEDAKQYFSDLDLHQKEFETLQGEDSSLIDLAFNKSKADDRKAWLDRFEPGTYMDHSVDKIPISDFINKELVLFSINDCHRSIPSFVDGMKPGHRKILYCCFKRNLKNEIKVTQLAGYVSEHSAYHHGEASLFSSMINMAQNYIGSNNLNVLEPRGQFGTRLQGGADAASPRYIFTALNSLARVIYHPEDDVLLKYLNDDGQDIEPEWYIPILPMVLVNGAQGIGTGWSSSIPNFNPRDIVENIHRMMDGSEPQSMKPWYRGFKGTIEEDGKTKGSYKVSGTILKTSDTTVDITELPVKTWTQNYKEFLEKAMIGDEAKKITPWVKDYKEYHTDTSVHFTVTLSEEAMKQAEAEGLEKRFKLVANLSTSNMTCFDVEGRICKYENVESLMKSFYNLRLKYYIKRKEAMLTRLTFEWTRLDNKVRFIQEIISGKLVVQNRKKKEILKDLVARDYFRIPKAKIAKVAGGTEAGAEEEEEEEPVESGVPAAGDFDYLLSMPIWSLTYEKVESLSHERSLKQDEITVLTGKTPTMLWRADLDEFLVHWDAYEEELREQESRSGPRKGKGSKSAAAKKKTAAAKKKALDSDVEMDASDDDFEAKPKKKVTAAPVVPKPKAVSKPAAAPPAIAKPAEKDVTDLPSWMKGGSPLPSLKISGVKNPEKPKPMALPKTTIVISDGEDDDVEPKVTKPAPKKTAAKDSESDDFMEDVQETKPAQNKRKTTKTKLVESSDSDGDAEIEEAKPKPIAKRVTKAKISDDDENGNQEVNPVKVKAAAKKAPKAKVTEDPDEDAKPAKVVKSKESKPAKSVAKPVTVDSDDGEKEADDFAFDVSPPRKKAATTKASAKEKEEVVEPKKRQLGASKAVLPGKAFKPVVTTTKVAPPPIIDISSDDEKPVPVAVVQKAAKPKGGNIASVQPKLSSPGKRARSAVTSDEEEEDDDDDEKPVSKPVVRGGRAKAKASYKIDDSDEDESDEKDDDSEVEFSAAEESD